MQFSSAFLAYFVLTKLVSGLPTTVISGNGTALTGSPFVVATDGDTLATTSIPTTITDPTCFQPPVSALEKDWSSEDDIKKATDDPLRKSAMFWSGTTGGTSVLSSAEKCTAHVVPQAYTIGMMMCQKGGITMPSDAATGEKANHLWDVASQAFASNAVGTTFVTLGQSLNPRGTWARIELPTLKANKKIRMVIQVDTATCQNRCFWLCNIPNCQGLQKCPGAP